MPEIRPIKDLRNTMEISELCHQLEEPIFITKNGYGDMVLMSLETYEKSLAKLDLYEKLAQAEKQLNHEESFLEAEQVFEKLKEKYGK
ncbi:MULTISPECIES: type II toxin-antitoxin system Phd/YefM family antitoxin [Oceanobacillus]|uniref:Antitoxin n=1 Tax=Oceanobacillus neutriphilus TaxID=531815 RepID=A0ABQ2NVY8_9BACI|nr:MULTISPECIES: type II toxin-antitoxin system Phd/YefM family antitoxin [Oceanobacillus]MCT1904582.1 type II toxin-antitoxin system Phd/YefM family antitoxin [Oceanobacillus sojae]GGP11934.1 prevent-host-death protein [Oceanobacillus neutriphilus]